MPTTTALKTSTTSTKVSKRGDLTWGAPMGRWVDGCGDGGAGGDGVKDQGGVVRVVGMWGLGDA